MPLRRLPHAEPHAHPDPHRLRARPALVLGAGGLLLLAIGVTVAGPTLGVSGAMLVCLAAIAPAWTWLRVRGIEIDCRVDAVSVVEGETLRIKVTVSTPRPWGFAGLRLSHPLLPQPVWLADAGSPTTDRGDRRRRRRGLMIGAPVAGRGRLQIPAPTLVSADPLALSERGAATAAHAVEVIVLPRTEPVQWAPAEGRRRLAAARTGAPLAPGIDLVGLRPYQPGTPASRIHWASLARSGDLLERVHGQEPTGPPAIVVDPRSHRRGTEDPLAAIIRAAASLTVELARTVPVQLWLGPRPITVAPGLAGWPGAHLALALLPLAPLDAPAPALPPAGSAVIYLCVDPGLLGGLGEHRRADVIVVLPEVTSSSGWDPGGDAWARVAGCRAVRLGEERG
ncbi:DUF58 domain-containing protein [Conexibacter sp. DBS9H8]|uniref:DUF58 domain-containing protein n=1 Tax=Conexibacter sp. DBS9H8 TaxID=2937801 RepID=UPI00200DD50B|nr:DUF58 domain-containing protein [Conexibacter sp. DBS9H8]